MAELENKALPEEDPENPLTPLDTDEIEFNESFQSEALQAPRVDTDDLHHICSRISHNFSVKQYSCECSYICHHNILIVDDENMNLVILYSLLSSFGLKPIVCNTGDQAVSIFKQKLQAKCCANKFDLVLTDLQMPETDGIKLAKEIRATEEGWVNALLKDKKRRAKVDKPVPIVAVTAHLEKSLEEL